VSLRRALAVVLAGALLALSACGREVDEAQARMCRMTIPALNPPGADIRVTRTTPERRNREIRVYYTVTREGEGLRRRYVRCRFAAVPRSQIEPDLESLATESGPVTGASLYLMKRYWLRTPEAFEADPGLRS
jgi:branched-chain amino acid transport system permease protein